MSFLQNYLNRQRREYNQEVQRAQAANKVNINTALQEIQQKGGLGRSALERYVAGGIDPDYLRNIVNSMGLQIGKKANQYTGFKQPAQRQPQGISDYVANFANPAQNAQAVNNAIFKQTPRVETRIPDPFDPRMNLALPQVINMPEQVAETPDTSTDETDEADDLLATIDDLFNQQDQRLDEFADYINNVTPEMVYSGSAGVDTSDLKITPAGTGRRRGGTGAFKNRNRRKIRTIKSVNV